VLVAEQLDGPSRGRLEVRETDRALGELDAEDG
jgi:hypothetical protein